MFMKKIICAIINFFNITLRIGNFSFQKNLRFGITFKCGYTFFGIAGNAIQIGHMQERRFSRQRHILF